MLIALLSVGSTWRARGAAGAAGAPGAGTSTGQDRGNAAFWYQRALDAYDKLDEQTRRLVGEFDSSQPDFVITDELRVALAQVQPVLRAARRGAQKDYSDFNLAYDQGYDLRLPHLSPLRSIMQMMQTDAMVLLREGDSASAAIAVASMYDLAGHLADDRTLISSLVGQHMFSGADQVAQAGFDRGAFSEDDAATMLKAINSLGQRDAFGAVESIAMEREIMAVWFDNHFSGEDGGEKLVEELRWITEDPDQLEQIGAMTRDDLDDGLAEIDRMMVQVVAAFDNPDREAGAAELAVVEQAIESGEFGVIAQLMLPAYGRVHERMVETENLISDRLAALGEIVLGDVTVEELSNAAVWYLRAAAALAEIDPAARATYAAIVATPGELPGRTGDEEAQAIEQAAPVIELVAQGAALRRCDFAPFRGGAIVPLPTYAPAFKALGALLLADTVRLMHEGAFDEAAARLALCFRFAGHLSYDEIVITSMVAHDLFNRATALMKYGFTEWYLFNVHATVLRDAIESVPRRDPFGYVTAITAARAGVEQWILGRVTGNTMSRSDLHTFMTGLTGEQLFHLLISTHATTIIDQYSRDELSTRLRPFDDLLDTEAFMEHISRSGPLIELLMSAQWTGVRERVSEPIVYAVREMPLKARVDLRQAVMYISHIRPVTSDESPIAP